MPKSRLRIPPDWTVQWNTLSEPLHDSDLPPYDDLTEDLLLLRHAERRVLVDLGWLPEFGPEGRFVLTAIARPKDDEDLPDAWEHPLRVYESKSYAEIKNTLEEWLDDQSLTP